MGHMRSKEPAILGPAPISHEETVSAAPKLIDDRADERPTESLETWLASRAHGKATSLVSELRGKYPQA